MPRDEIDWANLMIDTIRQLDPHTMVTVSHAGWGAGVGELPLKWVQNSGIDFFNFHLYARHGEDEDHGLDWGANVAMSSKVALAGGMPVMTGEAGIAEWTDTPYEAAVLSSRDLIWLSLMSGNCGVFQWLSMHWYWENIEEFKLVPRILSHIDWPNFRRAKPDIGIPYTYIDRTYTQKARRCRSALENGYDYDYFVGRRQYPVLGSIRPYRGLGPTRRFFEFAEGYPVGLPRRRVLPHGAGLPAKCGQGGPNPDHGDTPPQRKALLAGLRPARAHNRSHRLRSGHQEGAAFGQEVGVGAKG